MTNFQNGKIFQLFEGHSGQFLYGATCINQLSTLLATYRYRNRKGQLKKTYVSEILNCGKAKIKLVEMFPCDSNDELQARLEMYIQEYDCINKNGFKKPKITAKKFKSLKTNRLIKNLVEPLPPNLTIEF